MIPLCYPRILGKTGKFPYVWLRDNSSDPKTYSLGSAMKARIPMMRDFDINVKPLDIRANKNSLLIKWPNEIQSEYSAEWLQNRNIADESIRKQRKHFYLRDLNLWKGKEMKENLQKFDHNSLLNDERVLHDFLDSVCRDGIAVIKNGPKGDLDTHRRNVRKVAERIGFMLDTHFGKTFEVIPKPDASNMAYASGAELPYHTDFPSLTKPPELQFLHMAQKAETGGLSMFVDGFNVAQIMREKYPKEFEILSTVNIEFIEEGFDIHILEDGTQRRIDYDNVAQHKTIQLNEDKTINKIQFGNAMRSWFFEVETPEELIDCYKALKLFTTICYEADNQLIFPLENGDSVLWANTRLLHARSAYESKIGKERLIVGCYFNWDTVKSRVRLARDRIQHSENQNSL